MRVCLFTPTFFPLVGGAEKAIDLIARGLDQRGHDVVVLAAAAPGPPVEVPYDVRRYQKPWKQHLWPERLALPLWKLHREKRFEVVLAFYSYPTGYAASVLRRFVPFALVMNPQGKDLYPKAPVLRRRRVAKVVRAGYSSADKIVSISGWITERLHTVVGDDLPPIDLVHNSIDLDEHDRMRDLSREQSPTLPVKRPFVLHLGRMNPVKRVPLAIEAVHELRSQFEERGMQYVIVGSGKTEDEVRDRIAELDVGHIVKFLGRRTGVEKAWLMDNASFMVSTSREEGLPFVLVESMASGLPVLASDIGPHTEMLDLADWGASFRSGDVDDLTRKLAEMLDRDLSAWRKNAIEARGLFSAETMVDGYERACTWSIENGRSASKLERR